MERLYRPRNNRVLFGVCGGFAEYFHIDVTIIRIICILIILSGTGIPAYIIAAIIIPDERNISGSGSRDWNPGPEKYEKYDNYNKNDNYDNYDNGFVNEMENEKDKWDEPVKYNSERNRFVLGVILVGLGVLFLGKQLIPVLFRLDYLVPLLLVGIGGFIIYRGRR